MEFYKLLELNVIFRKYSIWEGGGGGWVCDENMLFVFLESSHLMLGQKNLWNEFGGDQEGGFEFCSDTEGGIEFFFKLFCQTFLMS